MLNDLVPFAKVTNVIKTRQEAFGMGYALHLLNCIHIASLCYLYMSTYLIH